MNDEYRELEMQGKIVRVIDGGFALFDPKSGWWENRRDGGTSAEGPAPIPGETRAEKRQRIQEHLEEFLEEPDLRKQWKKTCAEWEAKRDVERKAERTQGWFWKIFDFFFLDRSKKF